MSTIREAVFPDDLEGIQALDTGFATDCVFRAEVTLEGVTVQRELLAEPFAKVFPLRDLAPTGPDDLALVSLSGQRITGFAAGAFHAWNRRMAVTHLYVQPAFRQKGVGRALLERITAQARRLGAAEVWVECSNINSPALAAYERLGFTLSGIDLTIYAGTEAQGEFAFFMSKPPSR
jgi:GNAT superfamily N-acetyltransferase